MKTPPPPPKKAGPPPPRKAPQATALKKAAAFHIQKDLIEIEGDKGLGGQYTHKIVAPIYSPKNKKPNIIELIDIAKRQRLIQEIAASKVSQEEKTFLTAAAHRHDVFFYKKVADYYAHASVEMQELMEKSALVIIDFDKAIENGYVQFTDEIKRLYTEEFESQKHENK